MDLRRVLHVVGLLALIVVVVPFVVYAFPSVVGADHSFVVLSGSMEPQISPGDVVVVDQRPTDAIAEGDVITFVRGEGQEPVTHRVADVEQRGGTRVFTTKGDANEDVDPQPIPAENVIGEVTLTIPYIGHVIQFAQRPVGFVVLVLLPLGLLGLSEVWAVVRDQSDDAPADATTTVAEEAAPANTTAETDTDGADADEEVTLTATDLTLATGILALVAPYTIYVALQLRNPVTFTAAFAAGFSFLGVAGLWLTARGDDAGATPEAGPPDGDGGDGGTDDQFTFVDDDGVADWSVPDDGQFSFEEDAAGFAAEFDAEFGEGADGPTAEGTDDRSADGPTREEVD